MHRPKPPAACADLDPTQVSRVLAKHFGDIPAAARDLYISTPDLRRLTWSKPRLLEEAELERMGIVDRAWAELIQALDGDEPRRRMWAAEKILSSYFARNHPFSPARRGVEARTAAAAPVSFRWADADAVTPPAAGTEAPPISPPPELPRQADPPPALAAGEHQPWERR